MDVDRGQFIGRRLHRFAIVMGPDEFAPVGGLACGREKRAAVREACGGAPTIAFFWERLGVESEAATSILRDALTEAMQAKTNESPGIKSTMDDVAEAVAAVKRDLIGVLLKIRRAGRTEVSDLTVSVNALTPVSEPLYAVA